MVYLVPTLVAAAAFGQAVLGATLKHSHSHSHTHLQKKDAGGPAASGCQSQVVAGINAAASSDVSTWSAALGKSSAVNYVMDFCNDSGENVLLAVYTAADGQGCWDAQYVNKYAPAINHMMAPGDVVSVSFNPEFYGGHGGSITGGFYGIFASDTFLTTSPWLLDNTMGEYTFQSTLTSSTVDVSQLTQANGASITIDVWGSQAESSGEPKCQCLPTLNGQPGQCNFICPADDPAPCNNPAANNCDQGNGCEVMQGIQGYAKVHFNGGNSPSGASNGTSS